MASSAYYTWVSKGKPYTLTKPASELKARLKTYGYTVYDYPDENHQKAAVPEDHTPYSATEWPDPISAYIAHALDIMPPDAVALGKGAIKLPALARNIIAQRDARMPGTMWIKYMNWTDENGVCRHESWKTTPRTTASSTDKGHIHLSGRTDTESYSIGDWNPVVSLTPGEYNILAKLSWESTLLCSDQDSVTWGEPSRTTANIMKKRQTDQFNQLLAAIKAISVSGLDVAAVAKAIVESPAFEQAIRDAVRTELNATRLAAG